MLRGGFSLNLLIVTSWLLALPVNMASAQTVSIAPSAEPGRIERRFEGIGKLEKYVREDDVKGIKLKPLSAPPDAEKVSFKLSKVTVFNSTKFTDRQFAPLYQKYLKKGTRDLSQIYDIANAITQKYVDAGYMLSWAKIPEQEIEPTAADFRIRVQEGYIDRVSIIGDNPDNDRAPPKSGKVDFNGDIKRRVYWRSLAKKLMASRPLKSRDFYRYLLRASELPGVKLKTYFKNPGKEQSHATHLVLQVMHEPSVSASASLDNRGTRTIGPQQATLYVGADSLLGNNERLAATIVATPEWKELQYASLRFEETINAEGTKLIYSGNISHSEPGYTLEILEVKSRNETLSFEVEHPFLIDRIGLRDHRFEGIAGFKYRNSRTHQLGAKTSEDRLRVANIGLRYQTDKKFDNSQNIDSFASIEANIHQGLQFLNATENDDSLKTRSDGKSDFTRIEASGYYSDFIGNSRNFQLISQVSGQWAVNDLLASEEFGVGGETFGRAYDSSEITGDHGWAGSLELRYFLPSWGKKCWPSSKKEVCWKSDYINNALSGKLSEKVSSVEWAYIYGFYDIGAVYEITPVDESSFESLASAGGGIRFSIRGTFEGQLELAVPLTKSVAAKGDDGKDPRLFFRFTARL